MPRGTSYKKLMDARDRKLCERYFYWTEIKRRRFDDVLQILSEDEFFISEQRIMHIIRKNSDIIDGMIESEIKTNQLKLF